MKRKISIVDLGKAEYRPVWDLQKKAQRLLIDRKLNKNGEDLNQPAPPDMLFYVEHPHVYTLGKSGNYNNLLQGIAELAKIHAEFIHIDRGGDITYRSEEHTSELQSRGHLVCRLLLEKKNSTINLLTH